MLLDEIRDGDTVRLRNGETIVVDSRSTKIIDSAGEHPGPFVMTAPRQGHDRYLLADVTEVVKRNERLCIYCGGGVTSTNPETAFCRGCFYSGRAHAEQRSTLIGALEALDEVVSANVWHTGGGCMVLAITLADERLVTATDGEASLPDPGERWGLTVVSENEEAWDEWDEERMTLHETPLSDDELVAFVAEVAKGGAVDA